MTKQEFLTIMKSYLTSDLSDSPYYSIDYWHPLQSIKPDVPVVVFDLWKIYDDNNAIKQLEKVLSNLSIDIVTAIRTTMTISSTAVDTSRSAVHRAAQPDTRKSHTHPRV